MNKSGHGVIAASMREDLVSTLVDSRHDLVGFLFRRLQCRATAEDIAQDVFVRLVNATTPAPEPRNLIFRTAVNLVNNHVRNERRHSRIQQDMILPLQSHIDELTPERIVLGRESLRLLALELAQWPPRTREIFILNRYEGFTQREIASRMQVSATVIERHMSRAIFFLLTWANQADQ
jgi:RNA polymerase sigma factor (sigma-70 family)